MIVDSVPIKFDLNCIEPLPIGVTTLFYRVLYVHAMSLCDRELNDGPSTPLETIDLHLLVQRGYPNVT